MSEPTESLSEREDRFISPAGDAVIVSLGTNLEEQIRLRIANGEDEDAVLTDIASREVDREDQFSNEVPVRLSIEDKLRLAQSLVGRSYAEVEAALRDAGFDPGQPRDEEGQWTDGGSDSGLFYHGTLDKHVDSILSNGITLNQEATYQETKKGHVYVATTEHEATYWARETGKLQGSGNLALFQIHIPSSEYKKLKVDENVDPEQGSFKFKGTIKPEWIVGAKTGQLKDGQSFGSVKWKTIRGASGDFKELWLAVLDSGERALAFDPSQERDENGQWTDGGSNSKGSSEWFAGLKKIGSAKGSNEGGTFVDKDGKKYYVKNYKDSTQAAGEHISNAIYRKLGADVPNTILGPDGKIASEWLHDAGPTLGHTGVTPANADAILDHFVADVFTMNWDAVGTGHDNVLVSDKSKVTRVDQGGTLLHRAQGALKPDALLDGLGEWKSLRDQNSYYAKVFSVAKVKDADALGKRVVRQIEAIEKLRPTGGWREFVTKAAPNAPVKYRDRVSQMLESRQKLLTEKKESLIKEYLARKAHRAAEFNPSQERDENGQWTSGGYDHASSSIDSTPAEDVSVVPGHKKFWELTQQEYESLPIVHRGGSLDGKHVFVSNNEALAKIHGNGKFQSFRLAPGSKVYPDPEEVGMSAEGRLTGFDSLHEGSAIVARESLIPTDYRHVRHAEEYSFASTQINIPEPLRTSILDFPIRPEDIVERELQPHVTVKYGLHEGVTASDVAELLHGVGSIRVVLGEVGCFEAEPRAAGDVEGHEFHGNQYTKGSIRTEEKDAAERLGLPTTYKGTDSQTSLNDRLNPGNAREYFAGRAVDNPIPQNKTLDFYQARKLRIPQRGETLEVSIDSLKTTQDYIQPTAVESYKRGEGMTSRPVVATIHGEEVLLNGNHNVLAAKARGESTIKVSHVGDLSKQADVIKFNSRVLGDAEGRWASISPYTDRYQALNIPYPNSNTVCRGQCEGTGWIPVYLAEGDLDRSVHGPDEEDPQLIAAWHEAELASPTDDGWHFVRCPACGGSGVRGLMRRMLRLAQMGLTERDVRALVFDPDQERDEHGRWFSNSKVVDKEGQPLTVYHGSVYRDIELDPNAPPVRARTGPNGVYFTSDRGSASNYTRKPGESIKTRPGSVVAAHLSLQNPLDITKSIARYQKKGLSFGEAKKEALKDLKPEHDGVVFKGNSVNPDEYIAFHAHQIRRVIRTAGDVDGHEFHGNQWTASDQLATKLGTTEDWANTSFIHPDGRSMKNRGGHHHQMAGGDENYAKVLKEGTIRNIPEHGVMTATVPTHAQAEKIVSDWKAVRDRNERHSFPTTHHIDVIDVDGNQTLATRVFGERVTADTIRNFVKSVLTPKTLAGANDVVLINVISPDLHSVNALISDHLEHTDTHPDYHPHVTLAYVKAGTGAYYKGLSLFAGQEFTVDSLVFCGTDGEETVVSLRPEVLAEFDESQHPRDENGQFTDNTSWNNKQAKVFLDSLKDTLEKSNYRASIVGSVATKGSSEHDLDILLTPASDKYDFESLLNSLKGDWQETFGLDEQGNERVAWELTLPSGQVVDFWFNDDVESLKAFDESEHPRDEKGQWSTSGASHDARRKELKLPPAWTDVRINKDHNADLQATGKDKKGRTQYRYSAEHSESAAAEKFDRLKEFNKELPQIRSKVAADLKNKDLSEDLQEAAAVLTLIDKTGFRVGSDTDTGADKQAYGASTLRAEHVKIKGDEVTFTFVGKKGVDIEKVLEDKQLAALLKPRVAAGGRLFDTSDAKVRDYLHSRDGDFKVKDFRTWHGTTTALRAIKDREAPKNKTEYERFRKEVGKVVADHLGNTPTVALASYIDPAVWSPWKAKLMKHE
jgi:DNA topoisomerase-1